MPREKAILRSYFLNKEADLPSWMTDVPYDIRDEAMNDLLKAYDSNFAAGKTDFVMKFRSKKDDDASMAILAKHWNRKNGIYSKALSFRSSEPVPSILTHDARLIRTRLNKYYLCLPVALDKRSESQAPPAKDHCTIAIDPGVRTFATCYDGKKIIEWGANDMHRIHRLCYAYDELQSRWSQKFVPHRQRYRYKKAGRRLQLKIRNLVDDLHRRCASYLCKNYRSSCPSLIRNRW